MWLYFVRKAQSTGSLERSCLRDEHVRHQKGRTRSPARKRLMASLTSLAALVSQNSDRDRLSSTCLGMSFPSIWVGSIARGNVRYSSASGSPTPRYRGMSGSQ
ncbi:hypothetical protein K456DRAFT_945473 [Colletotrichum gloeosporioides 23]|nr:hypothetical protein K456DRAFT_945473 [Colletotrichum gloeosporioides 23]